VENGSQRSGDARTPQVRSGPTGGEERADADADADSNTGDKFFHAGKNFLCVRYPGDHRCGGPIADPWKTRGNKQLANPLMVDRAVPCSMLFDVAKGHHHWHRPRSGRSTCLRVLAHKIALTRVGAWLAFRTLFARTRRSHGRSNLTRLWDF